MKQIIFDCDSTAGIPGYPMDDALALFYLLGRPQEAEMPGRNLYLWKWDDRAGIQGFQGPAFGGWLGTPSGDLWVFPGRGACERCGTVYCGGDQKKAGRAFFCGYWLSDESVWGQPPDPGSLTG